MLITLFVLSITMFSFLFYYYKRSQKKIIQYMAFLYILLFGTVSFGIGGYLIYTIDLTWVHATGNGGPKALNTHSIVRNGLDSKIKPEVKLEAPIVHQFPELPRGCEITSLTMLFQYHNIDVNKMRLAKEIKRDKTPYVKKNGVVYFGDPNTGFVGNMYSFNQPGLGVYHQPLYELTMNYVGDKAVNLTGQDFQSVIRSVSNGEPVVTITNITYQPLSESEFETWQTPNGPVEITRKLHAVLVTGYDQQNVYFNDPYDGKQKKAPKQSFIAAWEQMGKQAISISL
ncbi:C39 family peptidase [Gracilibacillus xinjiangensis]|uniref:C39 family peptidase n=1 Tax=Gracilibacillus xinjiangensis TaxID=1193282 RepID=A0ABV8X066_9BACI